ncbi:hypothetical protein AVEN_10220-1 [Araneus ventricosus]|uniref:Uncharacterized protein n=1 Tax=Araneus ventricosus TaxID=182803 RepID=A0A4Y2HHR0_ARAVE|nr:hypothetical protein AVEN_10220-1 [Araneus ventricosus]
MPLRQLNQLDGHGTIRKDRCFSGCNKVKKAVAFPMLRLRCKNSLQNFTGKYSSSPYSPDLPASDFQILLQLKSFLSLVPLCHLQKKDPAVISSIINDISFLMEIQDTVSPL